MSNTVSKTLRHLVFIVIVGFIFVLPVVRLLQMSLTADHTLSFANYAALLGEERTIKAIQNTIIISVCSTLIAVAAGTFFAFLTAYTNIRRKGIMELLVLTPYIIPSYIITLSWSSLLKEKGMINTFLTGMGLPAINVYSLAGIILVMGICNIPVVYLLVVNMLRKIPKDMEWAARTAGFTPWEVLRKITLHQAMPAIAAGGVLAFLASIDNFSVPAFLGISSGIPVLSTYIYEKAISFGPTSFNLAAALSVMLSVIAIGGSVLQGKMVKKSSGMESVQEDFSVRIAFNARKQKIIEGITLLLLVFINVIPLLTMIASAFFKNYGGIHLDNFTLDNFAFVFTNRGVFQAVRNSILLAVITCVICIAVGTPIAYMKVRKHAKTARFMEACASLTYALPGIVLALAMIFHWSKVPGIYGSIKILLIAYATRYMILQIKGSTTALLSVEESLEEAGRCCGLRPLIIWKKIIIPMIARPVLSSSFLIFTAALTELTLSSMLASAGTKTIGLTIFNLQQSGDYNLSAAMSAVIVLIILIVYRLSAGLKKNRTSHLKQKKHREKKEKAV